MAYTHTHSLSAHIWRAFGLPVFLCVISSPVAKRARVARTRARAINWRLDLPYNINRFYRRAAVVVMRTCVCRACAILPITHTHTQPIEELTTCAAPRTHVVYRVNIRKTREYRTHTVAVICSRWAAAIYECDNT